MVTPLSASSPVVQVVAERPRTLGKFFERNGETFFVRGVTYGTFRPTADGHEYPDRIVVEKDFSLMASNGINAVRTYTAPPLWLLDAAEQQGLCILVGIPTERYVGYLSDRRGAPDIADFVRGGVGACAGHPAVLCYSLANEIPAAIVRWHGRRRIEGFLEGLYRAAKDEDPEGLVTYVSYPSTEYLELPFLDLLSMNVYLEQRDRLEAYLARLQNLAGERPLLMTELGLDGLRNGERTQAQVLDWQVRTAFAAGCAGAFVYAWTDEWHRGGEDVEDWEFGLVRRDRKPKPALRVVRDAFSQVPFAATRRWPRFSVVVCSYNGSRTLRDTLEGLEKLQYPDYEVIVVDDGSTDETAAIAGEFEVRLIRTEQNGLSSARNTGMAAATGEIVAYIDDDAWPDPHWLTYLAEVFERTDHAAVGGPNVPPPGDGAVAACVADAPGGPSHVLLSDREAEHLPGCNLAIRRDRLEAIGGFDPRFRTAGDDVDVCWSLQERGWSLGYHAAALVWHRRRNSVRTYWRQQVGYGRAEALLEAKWPEKYNAAGHLTWYGRVYGCPGLAGSTRIYHGVWGMAPFQSIYERASHPVASLPAMPEWYLGATILAGLSLLGLSWPALLFALPLLVLFVGASALRAGVVAMRARGALEEPVRWRRIARRALTALLHLVQPSARLWGRARHGLTPWRRYPVRGAGLPRPRRFALWSDCWEAPESRLHTLESLLREQGALVRRGGDFERFDLEVGAGIFGSARVLAAVEEHGGGQQLVRLRAWPRPRTGALLLAAGAAALAVGAAASHAWLAALTLGAGAMVLALRAALECGVATSAVARATRALVEASGGSLQVVGRRART
jgi:GT2 family glycosyltransferase